MTGITKELMTPMLNDYVNLTTNLLKDLEENRKKVNEQLKIYHNAKKIYDSLQTDKTLNKQERDRKRTLLNKYRRDVPLEEYIQLANSILIKNNILKESDI